MMYSKFTFGAISNSDRRKTHKYSLGLYSLPIYEHNLEGVHWYAKSRQLQARMRATENNGATDKGLVISIRLGIGNTYTTR